MRIVICEDDPFVRSVMHDLAEQHGHEVIAETDNALEVVQLADRFKPDLVVLDLAVQWGSGRAALAELVTARHCVVVFSAFGDSIAADFLDVVIVDKPDFEALVAAIQRVAASGRDDRREQSPHSVPLPRRPSDADDPSTTFYAALGTAEPGDALLAVT